MQVFLAILLLNNVYMIFRFGLRFCQSKTLSEIVIAIMTFPMFQVLCGIEVITMINLLCNLLPQC